MTESSREKLKLQSVIVFGNVSHNSETVAIARPYASFSAILLHHITIQLIPLFLTLRISPIQMYVKLYMSHIDNVE